LVQVQYNVVLYNVVQYNVLQYNVLQYNVLRYRTTHCDPVPFASKRGGCDRCRNVASNGTVELWQYS
jgi:hypothetical protein